MLKLGSPRLTICRWLPNLLQIKTYWNNRTSKPTMFKINNWTIKNGFKFSKNKTQCIHLCNIHKMHNNPVLKLDLTEIPITEEHKFLGIIFDKKLTFKPHIKYLSVIKQSTP